MKTPLNIHYATIVQHNYNKHTNARILLYKDKTAENPLQNLIMTILIAMTSPSIPEAFGHNKPLFIADKIAKHNYQQFKQIADSTATWILNNHKLRKFIFYMSTFRERRTQIETTRRETP